MANLVTPPGSKPDTAADELSVLHPERTLTINGRDVTVDEYSFAMGLQLRARHRPFFEALYQCLATDQEIGWETVLDLIAAHKDSVDALVSAASGVPVAEIQTLDDVQGELLFMTWWAVNGPFFVRAALRRLQTESETLALAQKALAGAASTPP